jgi:hypothetical protein
MLKRHTEIAWRVIIHVVLWGLCLYFSPFRLGSTGFTAYAITIFIILYFLIKFPFWLFSKSKAKIFANKISTLHQGGKFDEAIGIWNYLISRQPSVLEYKILRALDYASAGDASHFYTEFDCISQNPKFIKSAYYINTLYKKKILDYLGRKPGIPIFSGPVNDPDKLKAIDHWIKLDKAISYYVNSDYENAAVLANELKESSLNLVKYTACDILFLIYKKNGEESKMQTCIMDMIECAPSEELRERVRGIQ